jgi:hypothetical protein
MFEIVQTASRAHPAVYGMITGGSYPEGISPEFMLAFIYTSTSQYTLTAWRLVRNKVFYYKET